MIVAQRSAMNMQTAFRMILLSIIGYEDELDYGLTSLDLTLSDDTHALIDAIQERLSQASDSERAAFEALLTACFPIESITIDGITYDYFVIELSITIDNTPHYERYGFRFDADDGWIFTRLSIGDNAQ